MTSPKKKKILLADDDASMRRFLEIVLQKANYEVIAAEDGLSAMQIALATEIDVVVADAIMPNLTGYDLCRMLRANPDKKEIPLVILSGLEQKNNDDCLADVYLVKSANLKEELLETLAGFFTAEAQRHRDF
ncbi:MAG TPA: response regulator [Pyrinomonadaceae bacterium]|jgi:CheY-like chemotaxis protein